jgi:hypothetical protein
MKSLALEAPKVPYDILQLEIDQKKEVPWWLPTLVHITFSLI